ncbi:hypothetical protein K501DRAFT_95229 [Backusella circina FSU 941]|nr:hypothetical protein K501DRAFT_95229 [Backusella circina FSU 941]
MALVSCIQDQGSYYRKLTNELRCEANIEVELTHINQEQTRLARLIETKQQEISSLEKNSKKEFRDVRKLRHLSFRSAAATLSGKKKELVAKEEAKYQLAFENEQRSKRQLEELQSDYQIVLQKKNELERQKHHYENVKGQYQSLVEQR